MMPIYSVKLIIMNLNFLLSYLTSQMLNQAQVQQWFVCFPNAKCPKVLQYMHTKRYLTINVCVFDKCKRLLPFCNISNQTKKRYTSYSYVLRMRELIDGYLNHNKRFFFYLSSLPCSNISHQGTTQLRKPQSISQCLTSFLFLCKHRNTAQTINI